jgi:hypothetical protein
VDGETPREPVMVRTVRVERRDRRDSLET